MATLEHLCGQGLLLPFITDLDVGEVARRRLFVTPGLDAWMTNTLPGLPRDRGRSLSPLEQVDMMLHDFIVGRPMVYAADRRRLDPQAFNVWELKTEDVRVFGWFPRKGAFVAVRAAMRKDLKPASLYQPFIEHVRAFRDALPLAEPKTTTGITADDLL